MLFRPESWLLLLCSRVVIRRPTNCCGQAMIARWSELLEQHWGGGSTPWRPTEAGVARRLMFVAKGDDTHGHGFHDGVKESWQFYSAIIMAMLYRGMTARQQAWKHQSWNMEQPGITWQPMMLDIWCPDILTKGIARGLHCRQTKGLELLSLE